MNEEILISSFDITLYALRRTHTVGSVLEFEHPCIGYINRGSAQFLYDGKSYRAKEGDLIYIAKGTRYSSVWKGTPEIEFYSLNFSFLKPYAFYEYRFQIVEGYPHELLDGIYETYRDASFLCASHIYRLLSELYPRMHAETETPAVGISVQPAIDHIKSNYQAPISVEHLARICHSCTSGFYRLFKAATGMTPIAYKHNIMVENAINLLAYSDMTIEEISAKVGFSSSGYFRRVFFHITGKTPKEVR